MSVADPVNKLSGYDEPPGDTPNARGDVLGAVGENVLHENAFSGYVPVELQRQRLISSENSDVARLACICRDLRREVFKRLPAGRTVKSRYRIRAGQRIFRRGEERYRVPLRARQLTAPRDRLRSPERHRFPGDERPDVRLARRVGIAVGQKSVRHARLVRSERERRSDAVPPDGADDLGVSRGALPLAPILEALMPHNADRTAERGAEIHAVLDVEYPAAPVRRAKPTPREKSDPVHCYRRRKLAENVVCPEKVRVFKYPSVIHDLVIYHSVLAADILSERRVHSARVVLDHHPGRALPHALCQHHAVIRVFRHSSPVDLPVGYPGARAHRGAVLPVFSGFVRSFRRLTVGERHLARDPYARAPPS